PCINKTDGINKELKSELLSLPRASKRLFWFLVAECTVDITTLLFGQPSLIN
ncbi:hypothetical protein MKX01_017399, partial [Papaver californicum]